MYVVYKRSIGCVAGRHGNFRQYHVAYVCIHDIQHVALYIRMAGIWLMVFAFRRIGILM